MTRSYGVPLIQVATAPGDDTPKPSTARPTSKGHIPAEVRETRKNKKNLIRGHWEHQWQSVWRPVRKVVLLRVFSGSSLSCRSPDQGTSSNPKVRLESRLKRGPVLLKMKTRGVPGGLCPSRAPFHPSIHQARIGEPQSAPDSLLKERPVLSKLEGEKLQGLGPARDLLFLQISLLNIASPVSGEEGQKWKRRTSVGYFFCHQEQVCNITRNTPMP